MMSAVLSSFSEAVTALFQSFRLAFVLPAFIFWSLNAIFILPSIPQNEFIKRLANLASGNELAVLVALAFLLGYFLAIVNIWIIRLFEGYHWRETPLALDLVAYQEAKKFWLEAPLRRIAELEIIVNAESCPKDICSQAEAELHRLTQTKAPSVIQELQERFPLSGRRLLPTSLGNAIAAFEDYPFTRYKIDAVTLWPRLLPTLTKCKYSSFVEREKASLDFLLNLSFLFLVFSIELLCIGLAFASELNTWLIASGLTILLAYGAYKMSLLGISGWGMSVRVAFDLYRYDLLAALYGRAPRNFTDENRIWRELSQFLKEGGKFEDAPRTSTLDYKKVGLFVNQSGLPQKDESDRNETQAQQNNATNQPDSVPKPTD